MAKTQTTAKIENKKVSRPLIHAKAKTSVMKSSKNYKKLYRGQGK